MVKWSFANYIWWLSNGNALSLTFIRRIEIDSCFGGLINHLIQPKDTLTDSAVGIVFHTGHKERYIRGWRDQASILAGWFKLILDLNPQGIHLSYELSLASHMFVSRIPTSEEGLALHCGSRARIIIFHFSWQRNESPPRFIDYVINEHLTFLSISMLLCMSKQITNWKVNSERRKIQRKEHNVH